MGAFGVAKSTALRYLREQSSVAGLTHAARAKSVGRCVYWLGLFLLGLGFTVKGLYAIINEAMEYPVVTSTQLTSKPSVPYPAVTVCNLNRINCLNIMKEAVDAEDLVRAAELRNLSDVVGCTSQVCYQMGTVLELVEQREEVDPETDLVPFTMAALECQHYLENPMTTAMMCYFLHQMSTHPLDGDPASLAPEAAAVYSAAECTLQSVCEYADYYLYESGDNTDLGLEVFNDCSSVQTGRRRKREDQRSESTLAGVETISEAEFLTKFLSLSEATRMAIGHQFGPVSSSDGQLTNNGMIRNCNFQGNDCNKPKLWYQTNLANFGNCFTFNGLFNSDDKDAPRNVSLTGATNGLEVELFLDQISYMSGSLSEKAGVRVSAHDPGEFPMVDEFGLDVEPGRATSIAIQLNDIMRLKSPYPSDCVDSWDDTDLDSSLMVDRKPKYTRAVCDRFCLQHSILESCDCFHSQLDMSLIDVSKFKFKDKQRPCVLESADQVCVQKVMGKFETAGEVSFCPTCNLACSVLEYGDGTTTALWPSNRYWKTLALEYGVEESTIQDSTAEQAVRTEIQQNYLKVNVYFQTLNVREIREAKKFTFDGTVAAVGGALSLYLGVALILVFEMVELGFDIAVAICGFKTRH